MNILIPMAGEGSRFKVGGYEKPKPLIQVNGVPMIQKAVKTLGIEGKFIFVIRDFYNESNTRELEQTLREIQPDCKIIKIQNETRGSAETCLFVKEFINTEEELIITNCDQIMDWSSEGFSDFIKDESIDGAVVTYETSDPKHSFIKLDENGRALLLTEKNPVSNLGLTGIHYWRRGKDFVESAENNINLGIKENNEFYIAPTYNFLINKGMNIKNYHLKLGEFSPVGTPEDLRIYIGKKNEFNEDKIKTIICDIDGTILKHIHRYSSLNKIPQITDGVIKKFDEWDSNAYKIILMTGRKESAREQTVAQLRKVGVPYDQLVMDAGNGQRFLINDKLNESSFDRAISVNVITDGGFEVVDWDKYKL
jgi:dTDP-glucose pyrophosphorylase